MTIVHPVDPTAIRLQSGGHEPNTNQEWCVMEAAAYMAGEPWSDHPQCASKVITAFLMSWNDAMNDVDRQTLTRYLAPAPEGVIGTAASAEVESVRAWMATDWLVRVHTPAWLRLAGLTAHAARLEALPELTGADVVPSIKPALEAARSDARAARAAAWAAAWAAAGDAGAAAWAAGDAAGDAARAAAGAAGAAAGDAARAAAWAAWAAAGAAGAAAWAAARDALAPTVTELQTSAHELVGRMIHAEAKA